MYTYIMCYLSTCNVIYYRDMKKYTYILICALYEGNCFIRTHALVGRAGLFFGPKYEFYAVACNF